MILIPLPAGGIMALTIYVENELHERVRVLTDDPDNLFLNVCRRLARSGTTVLDVIDPYTDTMLNFVQLDRLIAELAAAQADGRLSAHESEIVRAVLEAAAEARRISGYLFFVGD
jgi:hypothetical protein